MSFADTPRSHLDAPVTRFYTFINGAGDTRKISATNVTDAWVSLSFREEAEVEVLVERGWRVKFK